MKALDKHLSETMEDTELAPEGIAQAEARGCWEGSKWALEFSGAGSGGVIFFGAALGSDGNRCSDLNDDLRLSTLVPAACPHRLLWGYKHQGKGQAMLCS